MKKSQIKTAARVSRHARIRAKVAGTKERPRLAIFRSNTTMYVQLINDEAGKTIAAVDSRSEKTGTPTEKAVAIGTKIAEKAKGLKIESIVFDRGGYRYQGAIAALADAARAGGLKF